MVTPVTSNTVNSANPVLNDLVTQLAQLMAALKSGNVDQAISILNNIGTDWTSLLKSDPSFANNADEQALQNDLSSLFGPAMTALEHGNTAPIQTIVQALSQPGSALFTQLQALVYNFTTDVNNGVIS